MTERHFKSQINRFTRRFTDSHYVLTTRNTVHEIGAQIQCSSSSLSSLFFRSRGTSLRRAAEANDWSNKLYTIRAPWTRVGTLTECSVVFDKVAVYTFIPLIQVKLRDKLSNCRFTQQQLSASKKEQNIRPKIGERAESRALSVWNPDSRKARLRKRERGWHFKTSPRHPDIPTKTFKKIIQESREIQL